MKNFKLLFVVAAAVVMAVSCSEEEQSAAEDSALKALKRNMAEPSYSAETWDAIEFCGPVHHHDLIGGQTILMGTVSVGNDGTNLYVKYEADEGYYITETHLFVGDVESDAFPTAGKHKNPKIGKFPFASENYEGSEIVIYTIPLMTLDDCFDIAAHAVVYDEEGGEETAWGAGRHVDDEIIFTSKSIFELSDGTIRAASTRGIIFADDCYFGATLGYNPLNIESLKPTVYEILTSDEILCGTVEVSVENDSLVFVFEEEEGIVLLQPYLFAGILEDLYTYISGPYDCPDYRSFPYTDLVTKIAISDLPISGETEDAIELGSKRWGFYIEYCANCN